MYWRYSSIRHTITAPIKVAGNGFDEAALLPALLCGNTGLF